MTDYPWIAIRGVYKEGQAMRGEERRAAGSNIAVRMVLIMFIAIAMCSLFPPQANPMGLLKCWDMDEDGFEDYRCGGDDCEDEDPYISPGADEICDGLDNNCNGSVDEWCDCWDEDEDGYWDEECGGSDCDDLNPNVNPGMLEIWGNGIDDNCDGEIDGNLENSESDPPEIRERFQHIFPVFELNYRKLDM